MAPWGLPYVSNWLWAWDSVADGKLACVKHLQDPQVRLARLKQQIAKTVCVPRGKAGAGGRWSTPDSAEVAVQVCAARTSV